LESITWTLLMQTLSQEMIAWTGKVASRRRGGRRRRGPSMAAARVLRWCRVVKKILCYSSMYYFWGTLFFISRSVSMSWCLQLTKSLKVLESGRAFWWNMSAWSVFLNILLVNLFLPCICWNLSNLFRFFHLFGWIWKIYVFYSVVGFPITHKYIVPATFMKCCMPFKQ
jgi:hypothetical protein